MSAPQTPSTIFFIQATPFVLQGSGASIGDTTLTLQTFQTIDGADIVTADLGSFAFGTLEPGNGIQEEAILFTGVTQNANGTATLTGVSSVGFSTPYEVTSGLTKTHAGASKFILSNDAAFYNNLILYLNDIAGAGAANASTTVKGIVQAGTQAQINAGTATGSTGAVLAVTPDVLVNSEISKYVTAVRNTGIGYAVATGTPQAFTATLATAIVSSLASGTFFNFLVPTSNATSVTLNLNSLGAKSIKKNVSASLATGDLQAGQVAQVVYDGTNYQLQGRITNYTSGITTQDISSDTTKTIAHGLGVVPKKVKITGTVVGTNSSDTVTIATTVLTSAQSSITTAWNTGTGTEENVSAAFLLWGRMNTDAYLEGVVTADATNISIAWTKTSTPTGTAQLLWEAEA